METLLKTLAAMAQHVQPHEHRSDWREVLGRVLLDARPKERPRSFLRALVESVAVCGVADMAALSVLVDDGRWLRVTMTAGDFGDWTGRVVPVEGSAAALAIEAGRAVLLGDIERDSGAVRAGRRVRVGPALVAPVWLDSRMVGVVALGRHVGGPEFGETDLDMLVGFAEHMGWSITWCEGEDPPEPITGAEYAVIADRTAAALFDVTLELSRIGAAADEDVRRRLAGSIAMLATAMDRLHGRLRGGDPDSRPDLRRDLTAVFLEETAAQGLVAQADVPPALGAVTSAAACADMATWIERGVRLAAQCGAMPSVSLGVVAEPAAVRLELRYQGRRPATDMLAGTETRAAPDGAVVLSRAFGSAR